MAEPDFAVEICESVMQVIEPTVDRKIVLNLPATVECYSPNVSGAFAVAKQRAFNAICTSHHTKFGGSNRASTVVVGVKRQHEFVATWHRTAKPFDHVTVNIGRVALNGCRQVQHDLAVNSWLDYLHYRFANLNCEIRFSQSKTFWRILVTNCRADKFALEFAANLGCARCNLDNASFIETKYNATLQQVRPRFVASSRANLSARQFVTSILQRVLLWLNLISQLRFANQ